MVVHPERLLSEHTFLSQEHDHVIEAIYHSEYVEIVVEFVSASQ